MPIRKARQLPIWRTALLALSLATPLLPISGAAEARALRIGWDSKAPYAYLEHKGQAEYLTGMDVELVRMIGAAAGFTPDFEKVDWVSNLADIRSGESDVALGAFYDEDRALYALFSDPYRVEKQVLFLDRSAMPQFAPVSVQDFLEQLKSQPFRLGIVDGYFYGTEATAILHSELYAPLISMARSEGLLLNLFLNDEIDGFISDRLVGNKAISQLGLSEHLREYPLVLYEANVHAMFSRATSSVDDVERFNRGLADLKASGAYETVLRRYAAPILLSIAVSGNWFFILDIIGTIAFAISGVLIARKESYSLLGAFVLASLPAVGGGVVRDLLVGREPIGILETPLYVFLVIGTVLTGYIVNWILKYVRGRFLIVFDISVWIVNISRYVVPRNVFEVFDAIGLASFTVTGVAIASKYGAEPLWVWGPVLAAITAAGGGILRDVFRADANNPALKTSFYAEIAVCWGLALSVLIYFWAMDMDTNTVRTAVVATVIGAFVSRMGIVTSRIRSPRF